MRCKYRWAALAKARVRIDPGAVGSRDPFASSSTTACGVCRGQRCISRKRIGSVEYAAQRDCIAEVDSDGYCWKGAARIALRSPLFAVDLSRPPTGNVAAFSRVAIIRCCTTARLQDAAR